MDSLGTGEEALKPLETGGRGANFSVMIARDCRGWSVSDRDMDQLMGSLKPQAGTQQLQALPLLLP